MFRFSEDQYIKLQKWKNGLQPPRDANCGAIGGRFTYLFTPTNLGTIIIVLDNLSQDTIDITDYDNW